jgi:hypothetical protein
VLLLIAAAGLLGGCGSGRLISPTHTTAGSTDAAEVKVIRDWAGALQRGNLHGAASYFALPSVFANGDGANGQLAATVIRSLREAEAVNASLSCGAKLVSTTQHKKYIQAFFRLTNRSGPGADCGAGTGEAASTDFVIAHGHIVDWVRAPTTSAPPTLPKPPANPQGPGQVI